MLPAAAAQERLNTLYSKDGVRTSGMVVRLGVRQRLAPIGQAIALLILVVLMPPQVYSQTVQVQDYEFNTLPSDGSGNVFIDPNTADNQNFPMPTLYISLPGSTSCQSISLSLTTDWSDPYTDYTTQYNTQYTMEGGDDWVLDNSGWDFSQVVSEGGATDIAYQINNGPVQYFYFDILGHNTNTSSLVDSYSSSQNAPWFWGNILAKESCGQQFGSPPCNSSWDPLVAGNPDGIGISQVDGEKDSSYVDDSLYWNYEWNITEGLDVLNNGKTPAYSFWDSQMEQMCSFLNGTYSSGSTTGNSTCSVVQQPDTGAPPGGANFPSGSNYFYTPQSLPSCSTQFTLANGQASGWKDADWIKAYNGAATYYIFWWTDSTYPAYEYWAFSTYSGTTNNNYVYNVCNASAY